MSSFGESSRVGPGEANGLRRSARLAALDKAPVADSGDASSAASVTEDGERGKTEQAGRDTCLSCGEAVTKALRCYEHRRHEQAARFANRDAAAFNVYCADCLHCCRSCRSACCEHHCNERTSEAGNEFYLCDDCC